MVLVTNSQPIFLSHTVLSGWPSIFGPHFPDPRRRICKPFDFEELIVSKIGGMVMKKIQQQRLKESGSPTIYMLIY